MHHQFQRTCIAAVLAGPLWALAQTPPPANALPTGGQVAAGQAQIQQSGAQMTIQQGSARAAIDWQGFNVGRDARVEFQQPSAQSVTLNRVQGPDASQIFGRISANGQVFLSNPNGVYFAPGASVDVGGLVATTHRIGLDDFMAGRTRFERNGATGSVVNEGELRAALGGYIALLAPEVRNQGLVVANLGTVALAAGEAFELQFDANNTLAGLRVEGATIRALVDNRSAVLAPGGLVILSAQALDRVQGGVIRNSGRIEATGLAQRGGRIVLEASTQIANSGSISANATAEGPAGSVRLQASEVANSGSITATGSAAHPEGGRIEIVAGNVTQAATGVVDASAQRTGGTVQIQASGHVALAGRVEARATLEMPAPAPSPAPAAAAPVAASPAPAETPSQGGSIVVQAAQITVDAASLDASGGRGGRGGRIVLDASAPAPAAPPAPQPAPEPGKLAILGSTQLSTRGRRGAGGSTTLLGEHVGLNDQTLVDATGTTAGGTVRVGGGWQGGEGLVQATTVGMAEGVRIDASATQQGDGGSVVLWSDVHAAGSRTAVHGRVQARGGAQGGNGGQVETSGHAVDIDGLRVDAGAAAAVGRGGLWLIDPYNYTIGSTQASSIAGTLNTGTSVTVTTTVNNTGQGSSGNSGDVGSISLNSNISKTGGGDATLTLQAHGDIVFTGAGISSSSGKLNMVLIADWESANGGAVYLNGSGTPITLNSNGGHVWIGGNGYAPAFGTTTWNGLTVGQGSADSGPATGVYEGVNLNRTTVNTSGGSLYIAGRNARHINAENRFGVLVQNGSSLNTGAGSIEVRGTLQQMQGTLSTYPNLFGVDISGSSLASTSGAITITGGEGAADASFLNGGIGVRLYNASVTATSGAIAIAGTTGVDNGGGASRDGIQLFAEGDNARTTVSTTSGSITLTGTANVGNAANSGGIVLKTAKGADTDVNNPFVKVVSQTGNILLTGDNPNNTNTSSSGIAFNGANYGRFYIGQDETGTHSGSLTLTGRSVTETNMAGGYLRLLGSGALTIQPLGTTFVRGGTRHDMDFSGNWNFGSLHNALTLGKEGNNSNITVSSALTANGPVRIHGRALAINADITSTGAGGEILLKGSDNIVLADGRTLQTNGGDITLWADRDADGGFIQLVNNNRLDSRTAAARTANVEASNGTSATGGGKITLAGGNGATAADGYARSNGAAQLGGVNLGDQGHTSSVTTLYSGGGDVVIRGQQTGNSAMGVQWINGGTLNAGQGTVRIDGLNTGGGHGMELGAFRQNADVYVLAGGGNAGLLGIDLVGTGAGNGIGVQVARARLYSTGAGGIRVTGTAGASGSWGILTGDPFDVLAASGPITLNGGSAGIRTAGSIGSFSGAPVTSSSSNVTLTGDRVEFWAGAAVRTSGTLTVQPFGDNFSSTLNWPLANLAVASTVSGLRLGKDVPGVAKTDTININSPQSINGPIAVYGGAVNVNAALTAAGDITLVSSGTDADLLINVAITSTATGPSSLLLKSARNVSLATGGSITAGSGALNTQFWADSDRSGDGIIRLQSNIDTKGGWLKFGNNETATINGVSTLVGGDVFINGSGAQTIATSGGQFDLFGEAILANTAGLTIGTGGGNVNFWGVLNSGNTYTYVDKTGSAGSGSWTAARTEARNGTAGGAAVGDSYLATITSRLENALASLAAGYRGAWIGAWRPTPTTTWNWNWADGPEAGQNFFTQTPGGVNGTAVSGRFNNFDPVEPNGTISGNESVAQFYGSSGKWNDLSPTTTYSATQVNQSHVLGFVRETNLANSPLTINAGSGAVTIHGGVGGSKALASLSVQAASTTINGNALVTSGAQSYSNALSVTSSGDLTLGATTLTVTNAGQAALFKAAGNVTTNANLAIRTNNGNLTLWSDSDGSGSGGIAAGDANSFNTANGSSSQSTGGGRIVMAGGLDDGSNGGTAGDGVPDGFAVSSTASGLSFGNAGTAGTTLMHSGGGDILLRGRSTFGGGMGIQWNKVGTIAAGNGRVSFTGVATQGHGIELGAYSGSTTITAGGGDATQAAISLVGTTTSASSMGLQTNSGAMQATGTGGITVTGSAIGSSSQATNLGLDALAASGPIAITAIGGTGLRYGGTLGRKSATDVPASSSHVTLTGDALAVNGSIAVDTTGTLTVQPNGNNFSSPLNWPASGVTLASTVSGLTLGKDIGSATHTDTITLASATSIAGPIRLYADTINLNASLTSTLAGAGILAKASGSIATGTGRTLQTNNGDITLWSDSDGSGAGNIVVGANGTLNTANGLANQLSGGGRITLAGGLDDGGGSVAGGRTAADGRPDGYAVAATTANSFDTGAGVSLGAGSTLRSGGGDVFIAGQGTTGTAGSVQTSGIWFWSGLIDSGAGKLALYGRNVATNNANNQNAFGIHLNAGSGDNTTTTLVSASSAADAIVLVGDSSASTTAGSSGLLAFFGNSGGVGTRIAATHGGGITLTGKGSTGPNATGTGALGDGIDLNFAQLLSTGGPITLNGTGGPYGLSLGGRGRAGNAVTLGAAAGVNVNGQSMAASSSDIVLNADSLLLDGGASGGWAGTVATSGTLTVQPIGTSFASPLVLSSSLTFGGGLGGLTLGKAGNMADITLASARAVNGPVTLYGGNLALNAGLTAGTVTLQASGTVSDGPGGFVAAGELLLLGGDVVLDSGATSVGLLAASGVGSLQVRNGGALTIGSVGGTSGIGATGAVDISTESGDLTLAATVTTSNTGSNAVVLNAGRAAAAGTAAGGDIVASGSPAITTGAGGRATLYSGAVGNSGLAALVGVGSGRFRYNSDEGSSHFSTALGSGVFAIYREQPGVAIAWGNQSVVYGTAPSAFGYTVTGGALYNGDAPSAALGGAVLSGAGHLAVSATPYAVDGTGALAALGYSVSQASGQVTVTPRTLTASYTGVARAYDGSTVASLVGSGDDRLAGDVLGVGATGVFADANAGTGKAISVGSGSLSGADAGNYVLAAGGSATGDITRRTVSVTGVVVSNKTYDGTTDAVLSDAGQALTGVGSETLALTATGAAFADANAGTGKSVTASGYALVNGTNGGLASNYQLASTTAAATADIAKAVLTVVVNNDAKFITQADNPAYNGVAYTGFVNGETAAVLGGAATLARSNAGTEGAGIYTGVLVADTSGLTAANYSFQARAGSYTIVPSNQLLVRVANTTGTYGGTTAHSVTSAQYFDGSSAIDLPGITANGGNSFTIGDGVGGSATLTVVAVGAPVSTGGWTGVGAWQLGGSNISTLAAANFSDTVTVVGSQTVAARSLAVNTTGGIGKVYDGTTAMPSVTLQLSGAATGDVLGVSAQGSFASRNAGSHIAYTVNGIALSGADAANYYVSGGTSFSGSNGSITPRTLNVGYTGVNKVYDGNTSASVASSDDRIAGDVLSVSATGAFADKNVGSGKPVAVSGAVLGGADAGNYRLASTTGSTTADITRLGSVTWVGGNSGNWFDPANWAGGAVPDLANVANVVIPDGVTVAFDTTGAVAPAQSGPVQIDSLGGAGGGLVQNNGALDVGGGGITLGGLAQNGGTLHSQGSIVVNDFRQTGGTTGTQGDLTVNGNFSQGPNGAVTVDGHASITDILGGVTLGNLQTGGDLTVTSTDGGIAQQAGTVIAVDGTTTVDAGTHGIVLDGPGNDFKGPFNAVGGDITVVDGTGGLVIGNIDARGDLDATSTGGDIAQQAGTVVRVQGTTTVDAGTGDIVLDGPNNDFQGPFNGRGKDIAVVDGSGGLVLGDIGASGNFDATSTGGNITQRAGTAVRVGGATTVDAGTADIVLDGPDNDFTGPFNATGRDITVVDGAGGLVVGNVAGGGRFVATSTGGSISQAGGSVVAVAGDAVFSAPGASVTLAASGNRFGGRVDMNGNGDGNGDGDGDGEGDGEVLPVVVPPVIAPPPLPVPETAPQAIEASGLLVLAGGSVSAVAPAALGDGVAVRLDVAPSAQGAGLVTVEVPQQMTATGFSFVLPQALTAQLPADAPITATLEDGSPLPAWLQFDAAGRRFTASAVPPAGLPIRVRIGLGGRQLVVQIAVAAGR